MFGFIAYNDSIMGCAHYKGFKKLSQATIMLLNVKELSERLNDGMQRRYTEIYSYEEEEMESEFADGKVNSCGYSYTTGKWEEITQKLYWYFLEVLPPIYGPRGAFAVSEPLRHTKEGRAVYTICVRVGERFFATIGTYQQMQMGQLGEIPA